MDWLKSQWSSWKVRVTFVGGALVIATAYGTCEVDPAAVSTDTTEAATEVTTTTTTESVEVSATTTTETEATSAEGETTGTTESETTTE